MTFNVYVLKEAEQDLLDIYHYLAEATSNEKASRVIDRLEATCLRLETMPERGRIPPELEAIGILEYRELIDKPYRIIYQVLEQEVFVHCILDGRQSMQDLLFLRLLRPSNQTIN